MAVTLQECDAHIARELQSLAERQSVDSVSFLDHVNRCWQVSKVPPLLAALLRCKATAVVTGAGRYGSCPVPSNEQVGTAMWGVNLKALTCQV